MRTLRTAVPAALLVLLALTACGGGGTPTPAPTTPAAGDTPAPTTPPTATPAEEMDADAAAIVVTGESLQVFDTDGVAIFGTLYLDDPASLAIQLGSLIGAPAVTSTTAEGTGCDSDQRMYDYGGLLIRTPGFIGAAAPWEVVVTAWMTPRGLTISSVGGAGIGMDVATFAAEVGDEILLSEQGSSAWYGFDVQNPEAPEYEQIGVLARFEGGVLTQLNAPYLFYADC
jgi:hypothetical protein